MAKIGEALSSFMNQISGNNSHMEKGSIAELMAEDTQKAKETGKPGLFQRIQEKVSAFFASKCDLTEIPHLDTLTNLKEKKPMPSSEGEFESLEETTKAEDRTAAVARATQGLSTFEKRTNGMERGSISSVVFDDED